MNGIGLVIPGADFTGSPLGKVTVVESALERAISIVDAYTEVTEVSNTVPLVNLVKGLIEEGIWDYVKAFYPMMGSSLPRKMADLKDPDGHVLWNAYNFMDSTKGIFIDNGIDPGFPFDGLWNYQCAFKDVGLAIAFKLKLEDTQNLHTLMVANSYKDSENIEEPVVINPGTYPIYLRTSAAGIQVGSTSTPATKPISPKGTDIRSEVYVTSTGLSLIVNGDTPVTNTVSGVSGRPSLTIYPIIGNRCGSSLVNEVETIDKTVEVGNGDTAKLGQAAFWGDVYAAAFLDFDGADDETKAEKMEAFDSLFGTFLSETEKVVPAES